MKIYLVSFFLFISTFFGSQTNVKDFSLNTNNTFTPNNDGVNDLFMSRLSFTPKKYYLVIRDKKNRLVYKTNNPGEYWDGGKSETGIYDFKIVCVTDNNKRFVKKGKVVLFR
jgi:gliding motility-associated-like protein